MHDTKIGIIVRTDLETWQKLNVTAFLSSGIAFSSPESKGKQYVDGSNNTYLPIFSQPVFVYMATAEELKRTRTRALSREVSLALYTKEMFATSNDVENRAVVKALSEENLDIVGLALRADRKIFDKIVNGLKLHS
jgi:hypothetical protein